MLPDLVGRHGEIGREVLVEDVAGGGTIWAVDLDLHVEAARPQDGRIDEIRPVRGADDDDIAQALDTIDLRQELRDDRVLDVRRDAAAARPEQRVHLVEEDDDRHVVGRLLLGLPEHLADFALCLAHELVEQLRSLDVQEVPVDRLPALLRDFLRQTVGHRLRDHRLAAARRTVEQHALRGPELVLLVVVGVEVRKLDGVLDGMDLGAQTSDVLIADVGHLFEREILYLALR